MLNWIYGKILLFLNFENNKQMAAISRRDENTIDVWGGNVVVNIKLDGRYLEADNTSGRRKIIKKAGIFSLALVFSKGLITM